MRIIIAPTKKMVADTESFAVDNLPQFLEQTGQLAHMNLRRILAPAVLSYKSIQYRCTALGVMGGIPLGLPLGTPAHPLWLLRPAASL